MECALVSGGCGQIGSDLVPILQAKQGKDNVIVNDLRKPNNFDGILEVFDFTDYNKIEEVIKKYEVTEIYHLACILSVKGEEDPNFTWNVNMKTLMNVLDLAVKYDLKVFWPSSIAVFGPTTPKTANQDAVTLPTTMYGVTKVAGEMLCNYYYEKFGVDVRSVRFPGLISYKQEPGGGTTDYAVDIFYKAVKDEEFVCFVSEDTVLPMMYMDDAVRSITELMSADKENIKIRTSYNLAGISFSAEELADEVKKLIPDFKASYKPDQRQKIADSWPQVIDDAEARNDWGWSHEFDAKKITKVMIENLK